MSDMLDIKLSSQERPIVPYDGVSLRSMGNFNRESLLSRQHNPDDVVVGRRGISVAMKWYMNELKAAYEKPLDERTQMVLPMYDGTMDSRITLYQKVYDRFLPLVERLADIDLDSMVDLLKNIHYELLTESIRLNPPTRNIEDHSITTLKEEILIFGSFITHLRNYLGDDELIFKILSFSDWIYSIKNLPSNDRIEGISKSRRMIGGKSKKKKRTKKKKLSKKSTKKNKKKKRSKHK